MKPHLIFVIGTSCSGKSSFVDVITDDEYTRIDDVSPLYKVFHADEMLLSGNTAFYDFIQKHNIAYIYNSGNPQPYSKPREQGGYQILNPKLWDIVLEMTGEQIKDGKYILQFSRGNDKSYNTQLSISNNQVYPRAFKIILDRVEDVFRDNALIINVQSDLSERKQRNITRYQSGGHFVCEETMDTVYRDDIFQYEKSCNVDGKEIPVYTFKNANLEDIKERNHGFHNHFQAALAVYMRSKMHDKC